MIIGGGSMTADGERRLGAAHRRPGTRTDGTPFDVATIDAVLERALPVALNGLFRKDTCGAIMSRTQYGTRENFGWEIDHIRPVALGGGDEIGNLQALHWENNRSKDDRFPEWSGVRTL